MIRETNEQKLQAHFQKLCKRKPGQEQDKQPGERSEMEPRPDCGEDSYEGCGRLAGQVALITGGDSGIGRAVAIAFAREGADVAIVYKDEHGDAESTADLVRKAGRKALLLAGDVGEDAFCRDCVAKTVSELGRLDVLVNNAAEQWEEDPASLDMEQVKRVFRTNIISQFSFTSAAIPELRKRHGRIINTASIVAFKGHEKLLSYSATKGAIVTFARSLSQMLAEDGIRVNAVCPGPIWTPLIPSSFDEEKVEEFGKDMPLGRPGQPVELAPAYVYLASTDSTYVTGQMLHVNGGMPL